MTRRAQTSDRVSAIAARYAAISIGQLEIELRERPGKLRDDIRSLAASALRQDEHKGLRGLVRRIFK